MSEEYKFNQLYPKIIYLQRDPSGEEITWCSDGIHEDDVTYIRKSYYDSLQARITELEANNARLIEKLETKKREHQSISYRLGLELKNVRRLRELLRDYTEMKTELARLREAQRWIPVSERLPDVDTETEYDTYGFLGFLYSCYRQKRGWSPSGVTHWRAKTPPPKADSTLNELRGIAPGITDDLSSEDFVRKARGEWEESDDANHESGLEPPQVREVFNRRMADGTFRKLSGFFDRENSGE